MTNPLIILSGNGNVARGAQTDRIAAVSARLNDQPVIRFNGGYFSVPSFIPDDERPESEFFSPVTVFAVYDKPEEGGPYYQRIIAGVGGGCVDYLTDSIYRTLGNGDADEDNVLDALPAPILYSTDHNGEPRYYSRLLIGEVAKTLWSCATNLDLHADIAEVLLYTRALEAHEHGAVRNYLALRYGAGNTTTTDPAIESGALRTHLLGETGAASASARPPVQPTARCTPRPAPTPAGLPRRASRTSIRIAPGRLRRPACPVSRTKSPST